MAEIDPDTSTLADTLASAMTKSTSSVQAMLSQDRARKLDLIIHLITNLQQSLVLCGPEGIGKTTLLENLIARKLDSWFVHSEIASSEQSFETLQAGLLRYLQQNDHQFKGQSLDEILKSAEQYNQKIVVIIDDAGKLIPGLIDSLCQFASNFTALRLVLVLTPDELHIKNSSDKSADSCHFIDVPPLNEKECGVFLKNLSGKPDSTLEVTQITSDLISKIYRETNGIPGKIVEWQINPVKKAKPEHKQWLYMAAAGIVIATVISFSLWDDDVAKPELQAKKSPVEPKLTKIVEEKSADKTELEKQLENISDLAALSPISPEVVDVEIMPPVINQNVGLNEAVNESVSLAENDLNSLGADPLDLKKIKDEPPASKTENQDHEVTSEKTKISQNTDDIKSIDSAETVEPKLVIPKVVSVNRAKVTEDDNQSYLALNNKNQSEDNQPNIIPEPEALQLKKEVKAVPKPEPKKTSVNKKQSLQGKEWVLNQKASNYSLQLMAIAKQRKSALTQIINKYPDLQDRLHYFLSTKNGQENYVLLYGSFANLDEAKQAIKKLPKAFSKPWLRSFKMLHKEIQSN